MAKRLYVGNLPYGTTDAELESLFEPHGAVESAEVLVDRATGRSRGFGFVEMRNDQQALAAVEALDGHEVGGRRLAVNEARPREERSGSRGGFAGSRGGFSGRRRY